MPRKYTRTALLWLLPLTFLAIFYFFPLGSMLNLSLARAKENASPFIEVATSRALRGVIGFTFWQAGLSTALTLLIGLPGAYLLARFQFRGKSLLRALTGVPFVMPTLVVAAAFNALLGPHGWINTLLIQAFKLDAPPIAFIHTFTAILTAHIFYNLTIVLRMVGDFWAHLDSRLADAARVLGASRLQAFFQITLPLLTPAISAAALLVFIFDFTSFGVILILGGPTFSTLEVEIYYQTISLFNLPLAAALSLVQLLFSLVMTVLYSRLSASLSRPMNLQTLQQSQKPIHSFKARLFAGLWIFLLLAITITPLLALAAQSVSSLDLQNQHGITLTFYRELWHNRPDSLFYAAPSAAIGVSLGYAALTVLFALGLGFPAAWALSRQRHSPLNRLLDPLLMLPLGTSSVTLGLGFIVALSHPPLDLRASPILIPLAHTLVAFPFVVRSLVPALQSIQPRLRQAAATLGATPMQVFRHIDLPLIGRAALVAATFAFTISIGEFGATSLLSRPEYPTLTVMIYRLLSRPGALNYGQALALSTSLMLMSIVGMLAIEKLRLAEIGEF